MKNTKDVFRHFLALHAKLLIFLVPAVAILAVLFFLKSGYVGRLAVYFAYMTAACTVIPLPTPPVVIAMGELYDPWLVGIIGAVGNCLAAFLEYHFIRWLFTRTEIEEKILSSQIFQKFSYIFSKSAFFSLLFAGFTPIPFEPFRIAAIMISYNIVLYLVATFLGRFCHYFLIALVGDIYHIPGWLLTVIFLLLIIIPMWRLLAERKQK